VVRQLFMQALGEESGIAPEKKPGASGFSPRKGLPAVMLPRGVGVLRDRSARHAEGIIQRWSYCHDGAGTLQPRL